jgi:S-formylglutathione hydrolase FrmB
MNQRLFSYTVTSGALPNQADVEVLLPTGYATHPNKRYPVLYLLKPQPNDNGWVATGDAEKTTAGQPLIVVMPAMLLNGQEAAGWCTNWVNGGKFGPPEWTTFYIDDVIPWVDQNFRTIANRGGRAIAGLSEGGLCAANSAEHYPELFGTVASYSGGLDFVTPPTFGPLIEEFVKVSEQDDHVPRWSMFGKLPKYQLNWANHDPAVLAENLRNTNVYLYCGNGEPGTLPLASKISITKTHPTLYEADATADNAAFEKVLAGLGIKNTFDAYGPGVHYWPYFARDLQWNLPAIMKDFAHPVDNPASFTFKTLTPSYSIFGWKVAITRPAPEFSSIEHAHTGGFTLSGSGSSVVTTPDHYRAGARYLVAMSGSHAHRTVSIIAGKAGDLQIAVPLGPGNRHAEYAPGAVTHVYTTRVSIHPH